MRHLLFIVAFLSLLFGCSETTETTSPFDHIKDQNVKEVLSKAIERAGGWETLQAKDSIFYKKRTVLYDSLGNVESDVMQFHKYQLNPELVMSISWKNNGEEHEIIYNINKTKKLINNNIVEANEESLIRICMSANYVLFMPFKLLDPGVELSYKGIIKLPNGKEVHTIAADYNPDKNTNHSTNDNWEYYFDKTTYDFVANMVDHGDYFALIYNDKFAEVSGLRFNAFRPSYRVNAAREHLWKRGEFYYSEFVLK